MAAVALDYFAYNFIKRPSDAARYASDNRWRNGSAVGGVRSGGTVGRLGGSMSSLI